MIINYEKGSASFRVKRLDKIEIKIFKNKFIAKTELKYNVNQIVHSMVLFQVDFFSLVNI